MSRRKLGHLFLCSTFFLMLLLYIGHASAFAEEAPLWSPYLDVEAKIGGRSLTKFNVVTPLAQIGSNLVLADVRGVVSHDPSTEYNLGIAFRRLLEERGLIIGGYAFYDQRRSSLDNLWRQVTAGLEFLTEDRELRFNVYLPERGIKGSAIANEYSIVIKGQDVIFQESEVGAQERALSGFDLEWGRRLETDSSPSNLRLGLFHFTAPDVPNVTGVRTQIETRFTDLLQAALPGNTIGLSMELQHDTVRGAQGFLGASLTVPFGIGIVPRHPLDTPSPSLVGRMTDPIRRDVDVVTAGEGQGSERRIVEESEAINPLTGEVVKSAWFVTATGDGVGTEDDPTDYTTVLDEAAENDLIVVKGDDGDILIKNGDSFTLRPGQILIGPGGAVVLASKDDASKTAEYRPQGIPAVITDGQPTWEEQLATGNFNASRPLSLVELTSNNSILGLTLSGGLYRVRGNDVDGFIRIEGNTFLSAASTNHVNISTDQRVDIRIAGNRFGTPSEADFREVMDELGAPWVAPDYAIRLRVLDASNLEVIENEIYNTTEGLYIDSINQDYGPDRPGIDRLVIRDNTIDGVLHDAIDWTFHNIVPDYVEFSSNQISRVGVSGISIFNLSLGGEGPGGPKQSPYSLGQLVIEDNTIEDAWEGISVFLADAVAGDDTPKLAINGNRLSRLLSGVGLSISDSEADISVTGNTLSHIEGEGIWITDFADEDHPASLQGVVTDNQLICVAPEDAIVLEGGAKNLLVGNNPIVTVGCVVE